MPEFDRNAYMREYRRTWIPARIAKLHKMLGGECVRCGTTDELEFDHVDRTTKRFVISTNVQRRWELVVEEAMKCQLLCRDCHVEKSLEMGDMPARATHGTTAMYRHHGCRCEACKEASRTYQREWQRKKRERERIST